MSRFVEPYLRYFEAFMATTKRRIVVILTPILILAVFVWYRQPDIDNLLLNHDECAQAFPALFDEIERAKRDRQSRPITLKEIDSITPRNGYIRAMIYDQQLYVIATEGHIYSREIATLHSLHRALISSPEKVPNIEFAFNSDDRIEPVALWGYARQEEDSNIWLIPDFGYWSWPETKAGSMKEVVMKAEWAEDAGGLSWPKKVQKVLWRGATMGLELREKLIEVASSQPWADVKALNWKDHESMTSDLKSMSEHCEYKYLAHTEGNSYSGRLKYLQSCRSVIIAHEMAWIQHQHPLMRSSGPDQNFVTVKRDFSDLQEKINWLQTHDDDAQRIANNNVKTFREHYLTEAAEVCYWRRLIKAWAEVSDFKPEFFKKENGKKVWRGLPVESFFLERRLEWEPY
ncbi:Lipopolysaccharide-modifying protein [Penicillium griseofulvum]|uniref:Lipopolysaccharide-modifying protein n=1 Tax=Penicillium patulum TaxID=5078 RepID=A0A135LT25_PENPA|nr:Lipopolysaccharide-modifying protein [Penicillium griseofulvum]KXG52076.1 Lipopolysaccharide-modifying protein [Penicillium griseofulvum]